MGMSDPKIVHVTGVARPSRRMRRMATAMHGKGFAMSIDSSIYDAKIVNAVAGALERALIAGTNTDGKLDMREAAIHLIQEMRRNQL